MFRSITTYLVVKIGKRPKICPANGELIASNKDIESNVSINYCCVESKILNMQESTSSSGRGTVDIRNRKRPLYYGSRSRFGGQVERSHNSERVSRTTKCLDLVSQAQLPHLVYSTYIINVRVRCACRMNVRPIGQCHIHSGDGV